MPIIVSGGGGGGIAGYKYPPGNVKNIEIAKVGNNYYLTWTDPDNVLVDDRYLSEWKGTIVVRNEDHDPVGPDDGDLVINSTVKNQYKENGLDLGPNGDGYFYGVFPYTKNFVFNVSSSNVVYYPTEGYEEGELSELEWKDIIYLTSQGKAEELWNVGDEVNIQLFGEYNYNIKAMIIGFNHDDLVDGGRASVTFMSRQLFVRATQRNPTTMNHVRNENERYVVTDILPKIKSCLPNVIKGNMKKIVKQRRADYRYSGGYLAGFEKDIFDFSLTELGAGSVSGSSLLEGRLYDYFKEDGANRRILEALDGGNKSWWTCDPEGYQYSSTGSSYCYGINADGSIFSSSLESSIVAVVFGFCI